MDEVGSSSRSEHNTTQDGFGEYDIGLDDVFGFLRESLPQILSSIGATLAVAVVYLLYATPVFTATTQLLFEAGSSQSFLDNIGGKNVLNARVIDSQLQLIRSQRVGRMVFASMPIKTLTPGLAKDKSLTKEQKMDAAVAILQGHIGVSRVGISNIIEISFKWKDPKKAADTANAIAEAFINEKFTARAESVKKGRIWLQERINNIRKQLNDAVVNLQKFKARRDYRIPSSADTGTDIIVLGKARKGKGKGKSVKAVDPNFTQLELEEQAKTYQKIYGSYLQAYADSIQRQLYPATAARIVSYATVPSRKSSPKTLIILLGSILLGGILGLGLALIRYARSS